jgi:competence protein ComEA
MRSRATASDHDAAVARRLELLTSELATVRGDRVSPVTRPRLLPSAEPEGVEEEPWVPRGYTRIRSVAAVAPLDAERWPESPQPRTVPSPGRHASRRLSGGSFAEALPDTLRGRVWLGAGQVAVVAVVAAVGLAVTCWWLVRSGSHEVPAPAAVTTPHGALATPAAGASGPAAGAAPASSAGARARVVVDVSGKVRRPGITVLRAGARVVDAIRAAGGARPGVDLGALNLARVVTDGEQIVVGGAPVAVVTGAPSGSPVAGLVDINTADETTLETLPEVGPVTAQSIITWRTQHGGFSSVDQLLEVDGIGDATLAKLTPYVTI